MIKFIHMWEAIAKITNFSPIFKGLGLLILACLALLFAYLMNKKFKEPKTAQYYLFVGLAIFIFLYGLIVLIFRPNWWALPY